MKLLITGATGNIGSLVVAELLKLKIRPAILTRDSKKALEKFVNTVEVRIADLSNEADMKKALEGIDKVLLINTGEDLAKKDALVAKLSKAVHVKQIVKLSSYDAREGVGTGVWHRDGEREIEKTGMNYTFIRPSGFMINAMYWADAIKKNEEINFPVGNGKIPFIHSQDIVSVAVKVLTSGNYVNSILTITGPKALSYPEMLNIIEKKIGKHIKFHSGSVDEAVQNLKNNGETDTSIKAHLEIFLAIKDGRLSQTTDEVKALTGKEPIGFDVWVDENVKAFF